MFQREQKKVAHWAECLCGLSKLTDIPATEALTKIQPVRHALICDLASSPIDCTPLSTPSPRTSFGSSTPSRSDSYFDITLPGETSGYLVHDNQNGFFRCSQIPRNREDEDLD